MQIQRQKYKHEGFPHFNLIASDLRGKLYHIELTSFLEKGHMPYEATKLRLYPARSSFRGKWGFALTVHQPLLIEPGGTLM